MQIAIKIAIFALVAISAAQAAGIKGQQQLQEQQQRVESVIKGPRQQSIGKQSINGNRVVPIVQVPVASVQAPTKLGPGTFTPIFTSKRPVSTPAQPAPAQQSVIIQQQQQQQPEQIVQQQQQQLDPSEIEPSAAAQEDQVPALIAPATTNSAAIAPSSSEEEANPRPEPYAFRYNFDAGDSVSSGSSDREEQQDASGRVTGFYTLKGQDGRDRRVDYVADANGFRATISTNELGTLAKDPADVRFGAQSPSDAQLRAAESATQAARLRSQAEPSQERIASSSFVSPSRLAPGSRSKVSSASEQRPVSIAAANQQRFDNIQQELVQLQEPFEQIRQTELNTRARKSRHAPFYLYTI